MTLQTTGFSTMGNEVILNIVFELSPEATDHLLQVPKEVFSVGMISLRPSRMRRTIVVTVNI